MGSKILGCDFAGEIKRMNGRQIYYQILTFAMVLSSALMIWKSLILITNSPSPIVVVLSGSMEPAFYRGDLLFLTNFESEPLNVGDITVFKIYDREIPIVHRVMRVHQSNGTVKFLTKGDNNAVDDRALYPQGQDWLEEKHIMGKAKGFLPYIGMVTIIMNDYPKLKYAVIGSLGCFMLITREQ
ncbi:unnamed protein product [Rodentolepis nana]|uniref:Signal peptidase complex catalytic subunit SEC11 n=1 Tax=Rodentolepis nana TaxID=102285 RepID=A0A0R3T607_RODNA|nr:unnamed protein product [Rodentolepis nana]